LAGFAADRYGDAVSFIGLAGTGALAVLLVWIAMPETRERALAEAAASETTNETISETTSKTANETAKETRTAPPG